MGLALGLTAGAYLQLLEEVFDGNEQHEALFLGGSHALTALANVASKALYGPWRCVGGFFVRGFFETRRRAQRSTFFFQPLLCDDDVSQVLVRVALRPLTLS